jgi:hypothetical protein
MAALPQRLSKAASGPFSRIREEAQGLSCRLFHQRHIRGPFSDETGAYFLCEIGHRIPCSVLPASRPKTKAKVWSASLEVETIRERKLR